MANITDKTVKSKYPPKDTNVTWIDTSSKPYVSRSYINGSWEVVGGGVTDYDDIKNKPTINGVELDGDKSFAELTDGLLFGGEITTQTVVTPDTSCYYMVNGAGTYEAFGVTVYGDEHVQILVYNGTAWTVEQLKVYNYNYAHSKFDTLDDIDSRLDSIVPDSASSSNKLLTENERHFKGWFDDTTALNAKYPSPVVGDYAYVKGATASDPAAIYECTTAGIWSDSGRTVDTSNVQTFASSQEVNEVHIVNDFSGGKDDVLSAEMGKVIGEDIVVKRWNRLPDYIGSVEPTGAKANKIVSYNNSKYKVIEVNGGENLITKKGSNSSMIKLAVLSEFTYNPTLPYTLVFATGETSVHYKNNNDIINITLPSDAKYVVFGSKTSSGGDLTPNILNIDGVDYLKSIEEEVVELKEKTTPIVDTQKRFIEIKKISETQFKVYIPCLNGHRVCYVFDKYYKEWAAGNYTNINYPSDIVSVDCWANTFIGIDDITNNSSQGYIIQGNTNYIYKLYDVDTGSVHPNHVGNGHGCEVSLYSKFFADATEIEIGSMENGVSIFCQTFRYMTKTKCFRSINVTNSNTNTWLGTGPVLDSNNEPIIDCYHFMDAKFELGNKITIDNRMYINNDGTVFYALYDAMLECDSGKYTHVFINTDNGVINQVQSYDNVTPIGDSINLKEHPDNFANIAEMYGINHYVKNKVIQHNPLRQNKQVIHSVFYNNTDRLKNYFSSIGQVSTESTGVEVETFNKGDVISVTSIREIELKDYIQF